MADTLPANPSAFLVAVAPLLEVAARRLYRITMQTIATDGIGEANLFFYKTNPIYVRKHSTILGLPLEQAPDLARELQPVLGSFLTFVPWCFCG
ncbi:MAG: hypothetical protein ACLQDV_15635 [Candidatus Binataceae bacterium]